MSRFLTAATRPMHLIAPGVGTLAAGGLLVAGLPPLAIAVGVLSLGTWAAMTGWELASPAPKPPPPPEPAAALRDQQLAALLRAVTAAGERVRARVDEHDGILGASFAELLAEQRELVDAATRAAQRGDRVATLLAGVDRATLTRERDDRRDAAQRARDREVSRSLHDAAAAKERELQTWRSLAALVERIRAELVAAESALDELHARVVKLMATDPGGIDDADVHSQVRALSERLSGLEQTVDKTLKEMA